MLNDNGVSAKQKWIHTVRTHTHTPTCTTTATTDGITPHRHGRVQLGNSHAIVVKSEVVRRRRLCKSSKIFSFSSQTDICISHPSHSSHSIHCGLGHNFIHIGRNNTFLSLMLYALISKFRYEFDSTGRRYYSKHSSSADHPLPFVIWVQQ